MAIHGIKWCGGRLALSLVKMYTDENDSSPRINVTTISKITVWT